MANSVYKQQIIKLRMDEPDLTYHQIAARIGCSHSTVKLYSTICGLARGNGKDKWKDKYFAMREAHPDWSIHRIAKELGVKSSTLYVIKTRSDPDYANVIALGRAALANGVTLQQIEAINAWNA